MGGRSRIRNVGVLPPDQRPPGVSHQGCPHLSRPQGASGTFTDPGCVLAWRVLPLTQGSAHSRRHGAVARQGAGSPRGPPSGGWLSSATPGVTPDPAVFHLPGSLSRTRTNSVLQLIPLRHLLGEAPPGNTAVTAEARGCQGPMAKTCFHREKRPDPQTPLLLPFLHGCTHDQQLEITSRQIHNRDSGAFQEQQQW